MLLEPLVPAYTSKATSNRLKDQQKISTSDWTCIASERILSNHQVCSFRNWKHYVIPFTIMYTSEYRSRYIKDSRFYQLFCGLMLCPIFRFFSLLVNLSRSFLKPDVAWLIQVNGSPFLIWEIDCHLLNLLSNIWLQENGNLCQSILCWYPVTKVGNHNWNLLIINTKNTYKP